MKINRFKYLSWSLLMAMSLSACSEDENDNLDDHPWNYTITEVKAQQDIPVGMLLYNTFNDAFNNTSRWQRITQEYSEKDGKIGPYVQPSMGRYEFMGTNDARQDEFATNIGKIVENYKKAKVDFLICPAMNENANDIYPRNINRQDSLFLNIISGRNKSLAWHNDGSMKFAMFINFGSLAGNLQCNSNNKLFENAPAREYNIKGEKYVRTASERLYWLMYRVGDYMAEPTYYRLNGRPVLLLENAQDFHAADEPAVYDMIRKAIKDRTGEDVYIIARQNAWTPPARWEYFFGGKGTADAITPKNMTQLGGGNGWERSLMPNIFINEAMIVNREWHAKNGINYIPSVSPSWNHYVNNGAYDQPVIKHNPEDFRTRCWVAKMNLGDTPCVIVDAYNYWQYANAVEPTDENYGNGWGDKYLNVIADEFKL